MPTSAPCAAPRTAWIATTWGGSSSARTVWGDGDQGTDRTPDEGAPGRAVHEAARRGRAGRGDVSERGTSVGNAVQDDLAVDDALADVGAAGELVHDVEQDLLEDGPQASGAGAPQEGLLGDGLEGVVGELELDVLELEEACWYCLASAFLGSTRMLDERFGVEVATPRRPPAAGR